jgi:hypothetical protein
MKPVVQLERTGCGIASVAAIAGLSYLKVKTIANALGIYRRPTTRSTRMRPVGAPVNSASGFQIRIELRRRLCPGRPGLSIIAAELN